ncbi:Signal transduction histidine kinase CheA [Labilithrix luteola]|uniref:Signal transduction histidine kinase CheA n=1 Tax=Labilithrix luteola TaxID=1391654 RepID=A0A0K1PND5_9BACT|nr:serine/threonine-protein kinase [Labilithrix luteola]AKU95027.1 Signal transduction histidine kinase CheA [Labilithrix luteola]
MSARLALIDSSLVSLEVLWDDGELVLSRVAAGSACRPTLVLAPSAGEPGLSAIERLEHAYRVRGDLDAAWAARPLELTTSNGRPTLLMEDPGGTLLAKLLGRPWEIEPFLTVAMGLASALRRLHERGLVHKDLKPANIFTDVATGRVWLAGFGRTSRLPRERRAPEPPSVIAGTLAYMAPEQTGRMNRSIDSRSDLYSCGVTLYEMLTGAVPFTGSTPMEWIHGHIARAPTPPAERLSGIPDSVSAIVMALLAKNSEDRYQTAAGLEADLGRCLAEWRAGRAVTLFRLRARDVPDRLLIPSGSTGARP